MMNRAHLLSLRLSHALRETFQEKKYNLNSLIKDILAGITVGIIAIPLSMALAIAIAVPPQYGLYAAMVSGFIIALTGGSRYSISGPTAAFVVILYPITIQYGLGGLLLATVMSGVLLIIMAYARLGRLIEYIPESVVLGFTGGIAIVIFTLQINNLLGLNIDTMPENYIDKLDIIFKSIPSFNPASLSVASLTLAIMICWPRLKIPIPPHLPAVIISSIFTYVLSQYNFDIATIGSEFSYLLDDGTVGTGIPSVLPVFNFPWSFPTSDGTPLTLSWPLFIDLLPKAFTIAMLGAIESLLCAVILDGMSNKRHSANSELLGQGIGNIVGPFFGAITSTAAIARSSANFKSGAQSPLSAMIHSVIIFIAILFLTPYLAKVSMPTMAALLVVVAWNMSETPKIISVLKKAPINDIVVLLLCLFLTVFFDMTIAIVSGIILASILFMKEIAKTTKITNVTTKYLSNDSQLMNNSKIIKISGPLFFAAADRLFGELSYQAKPLSKIILCLEDVPLLDAGGLSALEHFIRECKKNQTQVYLANWQFQPLKTLARSGLAPIKGELIFCASLSLALEDVKKD
ncbi:C4-dicarboxylic acid transporter DauA [Shewanella surugensis]|uniref:C4-dicarboxylic acid transporter DauA n=1 Tax=Shewanella surugensis TaxID=212020 RepID=A0ABT0LAA1_9GAMM|nr:C4-dicarboxylic acid transporter DauA [Shewanella surugensis]MCL1124287.1 C4-dicarboxylic acid transporter DauA [Shewanella surugensis]